MPPLKTNILIVNDSRDCGAPYGPMFEEAGLGEARRDISHFKLNPLTYKLVVFTGGADVSPALYGDTSPKNICHCHPERDQEELNIYKYARQRGIRMVGICRGMQFINVMAGGRMIHHLNGHNGDHLTMSRAHRRPFMTNSFHHQMCIPHTDTHILAWSHVQMSDQYIGEADEDVYYPGPEVEAIYNPLDHAAGVQWHPECMHSKERGRLWFIGLVKNLLNQSTVDMRKIYLGPTGAKLQVKYA